MTRNRRGFTLVELLVVTVLGSLVLLASLQVLITNRRAFTAQTATISGQQTTRMAVEVLFAELREVSPSGGDILAMSADSLRVRLMRKFSIVCETNFSPQPQMTVIRDFLLNSGDTLYIMGGTNRFLTNDSVFVWADNDQDIDTDDVWISASVTAVDSTGVVCPQDSDPAVLLTFNGQSALFTADSVGIGAPVRSYIDFTFGTTTLNGDVYLSRREGTGDMLPISGPLAATNGIQFVYRDSLGAVTATPTAVSQIEVQVRTGSQVLNPAGGGMVSDSILVWIHTRN
jgi:prepilin-type N-terminal cleavage/methylation domain-containing protein